MSAPDLSKLTIDRESKSLAPRRKRRWISKWTIGLAVIAIAVAAMMMRSASAPATVETATITTAYPTAAITVLNATGRVSAWRKASVSTKATGRLEWLGVQEGTRVKQGEVIARLENLDVSAARDSALATTTATRANLEQGEAEWRDAESSWKRSQDLYAKKFISESTLLVKVKFVEKDARVLPDMSSKVAFLSRAPKPEERKPVTAVRPEAIVSREGKSVVYLINDRNVVKEVAVGKPEKLGDLMQVSGLKAGDKVVLSPSERVKDGASVTLAKK